MLDISKLKVFPRGFFQDILSAMLTLNVDTFSKKDIESIIVGKLDERNKEITEAAKAQKVEIKQSPTNMPVSKKYEIFKQKNPDSKMTIEEFIAEIRAGKVPCKNCNDKEK